MIERLPHTTLVNRSVEELHRVVITQERIDDKLCLDIHGNVDTVRHVDHAVVTVRILHADDVGARRRVVVRHLVNVKGKVVAKLLIYYTWHIVSKAVTPFHQQRVALHAGKTGGIGIAGQGELVGVATPPLIGNLSGTLMRGPGWDAEEKEQADEKKLAHNVVFGRKGNQS